MTRARVESLTDRLREPGTILLDTILPDDLGRSSYLFSEPIRIITAEDLSDVSSALGQVDREVRAGHWVAGFVAYEAGYALETRFGDPPVQGPLIWLGVFDGPDEISPGMLEQDYEEASDQNVSLTRVHLDVERERYMTSVRRILEHIREGDVYQINYTAPLRFEVRGDPVSLYARLRIRQPVPYAAYIRTESDTVMSLSPELFFSRDGRRIVTRPMKGTARTSADDEHNRRQEEALRLDPKNRAENLMIVDLLRNDLSVCCEPGSVSVSGLFRVQRYPTIMQMTSTVEGQLRPDVGYRSLFGALFPSGSVTGAPKIRAMEIIREIEDSRRGVYCGAVGYVAPDGHSRFNVAIRTITLREGEATMGTGSGIVWDSNPESEYEECLVKARFVTDLASP